MDEKSVDTGRFADDYFAKKYQLSCHTLNSVPHSRTFLQDARWISAVVVAGTRFI